MVSDLQISYVPEAALGYGRMGIMLRDSIQRLGVPTSDHPDGDTAGTLLHCSIPSHMMKWRDGQRLVLLTMFETDTLPEAFRESMHHFDLVVVPSEQNRELFSRYHPNVQVINLGIDPTVWRYTPRKPPGSRFTFLHGGSGLRKGGDVAYEAFRLAFPKDSWGDGPEPWLVMKSPRPNQFFGDRIMQINGRITAEDEVALYENANCYVQPSRGEGFGLQPLQAIAQGIPTVLTDAHGHASFAHLGWPLTATLTPTPTGSFMLGEAGDWWEPSVTDCAVQMRAIYDNYESALELASHSASVVADEFTWDRSAQSLLDLIGDLPPYAGSGQWVKPTVLKYLMVLNRPHAADIAGSSFRWEAFTPYMVEADIKRILFEGGYLDPVCITGDDGLTDEQVARAGHLTGRESMCGTCGQMLNTQPTRADMHYAQP